MADVAKLRKDAEDAYKKYRPATSAGARDVLTLSNYQDFRDKFKDVDDGAFIEFSSNTRVENRPFKGAVEKLGVKLVASPKVANQPHYQPHVVAGGGDNLYGVAVSVYDDGTRRVAQVVPVTETYSIQLHAKDATIKRNDKICFGNNGLVEKVAQGANKIFNGYALDDSYLKEGTADVYLVRVAMIGNKATTA